VRVLTISLNTGGSSAESSSPRLVTQGEFSISTLQTIRAIDVDLEVALLSHMSSSFDVVNWRTKVQATVALRADDPAEDIVSVIKLSLFI